MPQISRPLRPPLAALGAVLLALLLTVTTGGAAAWPSRPGRAWSCGEPSPTSVRWGIDADRDACTAVGLHRPVDLWPPVPGGVRDVAPASGATRRIVGCPEPCEPR